MSSNDLVQSKGTMVRNQKILLYGPLVFLTFFQCAVVAIIHLNYRAETKQTITSSGNVIGAEVAGRAGQFLGNFDVEALQKMAEKALESSRVLMVKFIDIDQEVVAQMAHLNQLEIDGRPHHVLRYQVTDSARDNQKVGHVEIVFDTAVFHQRMDKHLTLILIMMIISVLATAIVYLVFSRASRRYENQLSHSTKLATIGKLAATIAHEVKNPLTVISCEIMLLRKFLRKIGVSDERLDRSIKNQEYSIERIVKIVDGIKMHSSMDDVLSFSDVSMRELVEHVKDALNHLVNRLDNIEIEVSFSQKLDGVDLVTKGDEGKLYQVLVNLINNANEAIGNAKGVIRLHVDQLQKNILISVSDNGPGIPKEIQKKIFQPFFTTKTAQGGTGIGLDVVVSVVESMGGKVELDSVVGVGTTFLLTLPLSSTQAVTGPYVQAQRHYQRVMVLDDDPLVAESVTELVRDLCDEVETFNGLEEASSRISELEGGGFDLVILDVMLRDGTGIDLLKRHEKELIHSNVLVYSWEVSQIEDLLDAAKIDRSNLGKVLQKPFDESDLLIALSEIDERKIA